LHIGPSSLPYLHNCFTPVALFSVSRLSQFGDIAMGTSNSSFTFFSPSVRVQRLYTLRSDRSRDMLASILEMQGQNEYIALDFRCLHCQGPSSELIEIEQYNMACAVTVPYMSFVLRTVTFLIFRTRRDPKIIICTCAVISVHHIHRWSLRKHALHCRKLGKRCTSLDRYQPVLLDEPHHQSIKCPVES